MKSLNIDRSDDDAEIARKPFPFARGDIVWIKDDESLVDENPSSIKAEG